MSTHVPGAVALKVPPNVRFAIIAARFNAELVDKLEEGCLQRFGELGQSPDRCEVFRVPGAFELPLAAKWAAECGRFAGVVCLGAVVRGDTPHFDYVAGQCAAGIAQVSLETQIPVIFGVLTVNTMEQALARVGGSHGHAGERAAEAAVEMAMLKNTLAG